MVGTLTKLLFSAQNNSLLFSTDTGADEQSKGEVSPHWGTRYGMWEHQAWVPEQGNPRSFSSWPRRGEGLAETRPHPLDLP